MVVRKVFLFTVVIIVSVAGLTYAEEDKLGVSLDFTYMSKYLSKGARGYGQHGALFKTVDLDFYGTGFGVKVTHRNATSSGYVNKQRFDYRPYYKSQLFEGESYATNYNISAGYEHYPGLARNLSKTNWEWIFDFSWPNIMPKGFVPRYTAHYEYPAGSGYVHNDITGWVHRFRLSYDLNTPIIPQPLHLTSDVAYNDGLGGKAHDWSYATFGLSTKFKLTNALTFVPGIYYQISMEDTVNKNDELYAIASMKYKF